MHTVCLPRIDTNIAWRDAARRCLSQGLRPEAVLWSTGRVGSDLFADASPPTGPAPNRTAACTLTVPRSFLAMAETVVWHSAPDRFARLYGLLWRLQSQPGLLADRADLDVTRLRAMEKSVRRCQHKMKAFVRFREIGDPALPRRQFAAWFEPEHHTVEPTAQFFRRRFSDMDWRIVTPDVTVICEDGALRFDLDLPRPDLPEDANEALWTTYFRNIFNPARLKVGAMCAEMPKKYWRNLPEAAAIPDLIATAPARARAMAEAAPTLPPARAAKVRPPERPMREGNMLADLQSCTRCPLYEHATQAVPGEGPAPADLMIVGEQPGDQEDLQGRPFVGPAGQLFDRIAGEAGLDRTAAYVTNAVKHFKFTTRGKRRIHQRPDRGEVEHCRWWLDLEIDRVKPKLLLGMGATAALSLTGKGEGILKRRGTVEVGRHGLPVLLTVHPSYILRVPDKGAQTQATAHLRDDLREAVALINGDATLPPLEPQLPFG
ncbi:MAG: UdgX family uracil-DNA binding protein [Paracoccaceae bacterium]